MHIKAATPPGGAPLLLVGYEDGSLAVWDLRTSRELDHTKYHTETLMAFDYHAGANRGLSASVDNTLVSWTLSPTQEFSRRGEVEFSRRGAVELSNPGVGCVRYREDGRLVVVGGWDGRVRVYSTKRNTPLVVLQQHTGTVQCAAFSPGGHLAVGGKDKHISTWNIYR